jgi:hypothetical protein
MKVFIDLMEDAKKVTDELPEASPEMRVCLHAERYANRQHQETRLQFVHGLATVIAAIVPCIRTELYVANYKSVTPAVCVPIGVRSPSF